MHARIQHIDQRLHRFRSDAGIADRQRVGADQHRGAHHFLGKRLADADGMTDDQIAAQTVGLIDRDVAIRKDAEAGVDAVHRRLAGRHDPIDPRARGGHLLTRFVAQDHRSAVPRHVDHILHCQ